MSGFEDFVQELFAGVGPVRVKRMFGGVGIYADGRMFGVVDDDVIYLKTDEALRAELAAEGSDYWRYQGGGKTLEITSYWRLPETALDDPDEAAAWGRRALAVAEANPPKTRPRRKR